MLWREPGFEGIANDAYFNRNYPENPDSSNLCQEKDDASLYYENVHSDVEKEKDEGVEYSMDSLGLRHKDF